MANNGFVSIAAALKAYRYNESNGFWIIHHFGITSLLYKYFAFKNFDSHDFIARFAKEFEPAYVRFLGNYEKNSHRTVHEQIARYLSKNSDALQLRKMAKSRVRVCLPAKLKTSIGQDK